MTEKTEKKKGKWRRRALIGTGLVTLVGVPGLWVAINTFPSLGPALADGTRAVFGPGVIAWAEDVAYDVQDRVDRWRYKDSKPKTFWEAPTAGAPAAPALAATAVPATVATAAAPGTTATPAADEPAGFPPQPFPAPVASVAAPGDGSWIPVDDGSKEPRSWPRRSSTPTPSATSPPSPSSPSTSSASTCTWSRARRSRRPQGAGRPPPRRHPEGGVRRPRGCLQRRLQAHARPLGGQPRRRHLRAAARRGLHGRALQGRRRENRTWSSMKETASDMTGYRQTPPCLVEQGKVHDALKSVEYNKNWGATVSGDTVGIRRSAIGLDKDGRTLFYGLGEACTAQALAHAMHAVGADYAAQLDVNYSYPRFLFYTKTDTADPPAVSSALIPGIKYQKQSTPRRARSARLLLPHEEAPRLLLERIDFGCGWHARRRRQPKASVAHTEQPASLRAGCGVSASRAGRDALTGGDAPYSAHATEA